MTLSCAGWYDGLGQKPRVSALLGKNVKTPMMREMDEGDIHKSLGLQGSSQK